MAWDSREVEGSKHSVPDGSSPKGIKLRNGFAATPLADVGIDLAVDHRARRCCCFRAYGPFHQESARRLIFTFGCRHACRGWRPRDADLRHIHALGARSAVSTTPQGENLCGNTDTQHRLCIGRTPYRRNGAGWSVVASLSLRARLTPRTILTPNRRMQLPDGQRRHLHLTSARRDRQIHRLPIRRDRIGKRHAAAIQVDLEAGAVDQDS